MPGGRREGAGRKAGVPNKSTADLRDAAREYTIEALGVLASIMANEDEAGPARVSAANAILDRAYGKPKQTVGGDDESPINVVTRIVLEAARHSDGEATA